jgi:hypothetical protein
VQRRVEVEGAEPAVDVGGHAKDDSRGENSNLKLQIPNNQGEAQKKKTPTLCWSFLLIRLSLCFCLRFGA